MYLTADQIEREANRNPLELTAAQATSAFPSTISYKALYEEFEWIVHETERAFDVAGKEEKAVSNAVSVPLVAMPVAMPSNPSPNDKEEEEERKSEKAEVMRKLMTRCI